MKKSTAKKSVAKKVDKFFLVVCESENTYFSSFAEAEVCAKDLCEKEAEEISIFEVTKAWKVYYPEEPEPETFEESLTSFVN